MLYRGGSVFLGVAAVLALLAPGQPASAACFESGIGCPNDHYIPKNVLNTLSCDSLWMVRNSIYDERGFCFKTARALETFSNDDCYVTNASRLRFNAFERTNIDRIAAVERKKGCR